MLDMGFAEDLKVIMSQMVSARGMIFSATVPGYIQELAQTLFKTPVLIDLVGTESTQIPDTILHRICLYENEKHRLALIAEFVKANENLKILIFTETKLEADLLGQQRFARFRALHGDMDQKSRSYTLTQFRKPTSTDILVATDVAARGLDIDDIDVVIQLGCRNVDSFVHRSGRTGRAGKSGKNFIFARRDELQGFLKFERDLKIKLEIGNTLLEETPQTEEVQFGVNWIKNKAQEYASKNPYEETKDMFKEFKGLPTDIQNQMVNDFLNEYIHKYKKREMTFKINYSLLGGNADKRTYHIIKASPSLKDLFKEKKINYAQENGQYLCDLGDEQAEILSVIQSNVDDPVKEV